jgi:hypothetical protein
MDFSGLKAAAEEVANRQKPAKYFTGSTKKGYAPLKPGDYIVLFTYADQRTSQEQRPYFQMNFEMVKVVESEESDDVVGDAYMDQIHTGHHMMKVLAQKLMEILGITSEEVTSDIAERFLSGSYNDGLGEGDYCNIPLFVKVGSPRQYTNKKGEDKTAIDVNYQKMTAEDCEAHGVGELAELIK